MGLIIFAIVSILVLILVFGIYTLYACIDNHGSELITGIWLGCCLISCLLLFISTYNYGYKKGQIDAVSGKMKYELIKTYDGTNKWINKEK